MSHDPTTLARPNPDALLARLEAETERQQRGKLKIFFGACPGVGKTFAMLTAARSLHAQGVSLLAGVVETHGRRETAELLQQLPLLPRLQITYKGHQLEEFDLDAALLHKPQLILIDELAHSNAPGSRHPKRWQDIIELLAAGIDVYTTVNVQHIESLNDVVGKITGIRVMERVPDHVIDQADEMVLVDLPPEELLQRLREGKVYIPRQAERAMDHFFRKGNLLALRELALRRTADRVDGDVRAWRRESAVSTVWPTREAVLVCVGPGPDSEKLVRRAALRANRTGAPWHAIAIETPAQHNLPASAQARILAVLKLAAELGAKTANPAGSDAVEIAIAYAREQNLGTILVGRDRYRRLPWQHSFAERLGRLAPDLELLQIAREEENGPPASRQAPATAHSTETRRSYSIALLGVALATLLSLPLQAKLDPANIVMIFLLSVVFTALRAGRKPAILAAFLSVASFDFFFVPPFLTFAVSDAQYLVTFAVMLIVALLIGQLTAGLRFQAINASTREKRVQALYEMSRDLSSALGVAQIVAITQRFIQQSFDADAFLFLPNAAEKLFLAEGCQPHAQLDPGIAQWSFDHGQSAGSGSDTLPAAPALYLPLQAPTRLCGILTILPHEKSLALPPTQQQLLETSAHLIAIALERIHYVHLTQQAQMNIESERLRNSLLSAISHDIRTPLTVIAGLADAMRVANPPLAPPHCDLVVAIRDEVTRTTTMVNNLLDMARMHLGQVTLKQEWQTLEEIIGVSMNRCAHLLHRHAVHIDLPDNLPLFQGDSGLLERVFNNLLENAAKHTPPGSQITLTANHQGGKLCIALCDNGPGLPEGLEKKIFEKFTRGNAASPVPGFGLGLAIVRAIIEAHSGSVQAHNNPQGGACFLLTLPADTQPELPEEV
ncbi:MAG: DUF4118 domain-containing protein [Magnetococcales bacterium]|nr:DUF4118 domain-containing protein [Magnetococcales bacterium]MBF0114326.1 DUF4118 domain-containing protein [Magnetococcales bacterium]